MSIRSVSRVEDPCECGSARVLITFDDVDDNGLPKQIVKHDDGSLIDYIGESNYQPSSLP